MMAKTEKNSNRRQACCVQERIITKKGSLPLRKKNIKHKHRQAYDAHTQAFSTATRYLQVTEHQGRIYSERLSKKK